MKLKACSFLIIFLAAHVAAQNVVINEFMADNETCCADEFGEFDDWVEFYNAGDTPVNIGGMFVTDNLNIPTQWQIPTTNPSATTISPGGFLVVWFDGQPLQGVLHVSARLSANGEQIGLFSAAGAVLDSISYAAQRPDESFGRFPDGGATRARFTNPTPGASNMFVAAPEISNVLRTPVFPDVGQEVSITGQIISSQPGLQAVIHYAVGENPFIATPMFDDGQHGDGGPNDGFWGGTIPAQAIGARIEWYIEASNNDGGIAYFPESAPLKNEKYRITDWKPTLTSSLEFGGASGLTYSAARKSLFAIEDDPTAGKLFEITVVGKIIREIDVNGADMEGIALDPVNEVFYVVEETGWEVIKYNLDGIRLGSFEVAHAIGATQGLEGVVYDPITSHLFLLQSENPSQLIETTTDGVELARTTLRFSSDVTGIALHPTWGTFFIVSDESFSLNEMTRNGVLLRSWYIPVEQAEGVTFAEEDNIVYIIEDRGRKLHTFFINEGRHAASESLLINEFMARNNTRIADSFGEFDDWVEILNKNAAAVNAGGLIFTNDLLDPRQTILPENAAQETTIPPNKALLLWADGQRSQGPLHLNFRLSATGEEIGLYEEIGGAMSLLDSIRFTAQRSDTSFGRVPDGSDNWQFIPNSTPGEVSIPTGVSGSPAQTPASFALHQNYPNPFNPETKISFDLPVRTHVKLQVFNLLGVEIAVLVDEELQAGTKSVIWEARNQSSGVYYFSLQTDTFRTTRKMVLLR